MTEAQKSALLGLLASLANYQATDGVKRSLSNVPPDQAAALRVVLPSAPHDEPHSAQQHALSALCAAVTDLAVIP